MTAFREIKLQLFGFALWPASLGALEEGRTVRDLAWSIPFSLLRKSVDVLLVRRIGGDLLKNQPADFQVISVPHAEPSADETMSLTEKPTLCATAIHKSRNQRAGR